MMFRDWTFWITVGRGPKFRKEAWRKEAADDYGLWCGSRAPILGGNIQ
jgi:hypothetical protein